ncbi:helix-turn-helix transcriptional regulator [Lysinibacillus sp. KU-BSD001]|uniref:helix-turn-helix domain-containing protein n=1 Tax=Lysinibacillus sp. KU-BSD001 TaxID=3141328 RepID=UPI0036EDFF42
MKLVSTVTHPEKLGDFLKSIRLEQGLTIEEVCKEIPVDVDTYRDIEENKLFNPTFENVYYIFRQLGVELDMFNWKKYFQYV